LSAAELGEHFEPKSFPVEFLSLGGIGAGVPVGATVSDFGPDLHAKSSRRERHAGAEPVARLPLRGREDIAAARPLEAPRAPDVPRLEAGEAELEGLGGVSSQTVGVLLRSLTQLEDGGGKELFGKPQFDVNDLLRTAPDGRGLISRLELPAVQDKPRLFSTALMWRSRSCSRPFPRSRPTEAEAFLESVTG
jgi:DNA double-strand break repair helicase HerA and related ATPase